MNGVYPVFYFFNDWCDPSQNADTPDVRFLLSPHAHTYTLSFPSDSLVIFIGEKLVPSFALYAWWLPSQSGKDFDCPHRQMYLASAKSTAMGPWPTLSVAIALNSLVDTFNREEKKRWVGRWRRENDAVSVWTQVGRRGDKRASERGREREREREREEEINFFMKTRENTHRSQKCTVGVAVVCLVFPLTVEAPSKLLFKMGKLFGF